MSKLPPGVGGVLIFVLEKKDLPFSDVDEQSIRLAPPLTVIPKAKPRPRQVTSAKNISPVVMPTTLVPKSLSTRTAFMPLRAQEGRSCRR